MTNQPKYKGALRLLPLMLALLMALSPLARAVEPETEIPARDTREAMLKDFISWATHLRGQLVQFLNSVSWKDIRYSGVDQVRAFLEVQIGNIHSFQEGLENRITQIKAYVNHFLGLFKLALP